MPLCMRCLSASAGVCIAYIFDLQLGYASILLLVPFFLDGTLHYLEIKPSSNFRRFVSGLLGGIGLCSITITFFETFDEIIMLYILFLIVAILAGCALINASKSSSNTNKLAQQKLQADQIEKEQKQRAEAQKEQIQNKQESAAFEEEWDLLTRYDRVVRTQIERLEDHGQAAVKELKRVYKITKDKAGLEGVADQIVADIESGKFDPEERLNAAVDHGSSEMFTIDEVDAKGLTADGKYKVYKDYQLHHRDDGDWWIETRDGELHPSFTRGYATLGKAKEAAASKLGQERLDRS